MFLLVHRLNILSAELRILYDVPTYVILTTFSMTSRLIQRTEMFNVNK